MWTQQAARDELRRFLNDGPVDRPVKAKKPAVGAVNGVNATFILWEERLVPGTLNVTVNGNLLEEDDLDEVDSEFGKFTFTPQTVPPAQAEVLVSFYYRYFTDPDLDDALSNALGQIGDDMGLDGVTSGLKLSVLNFAGYHAFSKLAVRWAQQASLKFQLEEEPIQSEVLARSNLFATLAKTFFDTARTLRGDYYRRQGRREAPAFAVFKPVIPSPGPKR